MAIFFTTIESILYLTEIFTFAVKMNEKTGSQWELTEKNIPPGSLQVLTEDKPCRP